MRRSNMSLGVFYDTIESVDLIEGKLNNKVVNDIATQIGLNQAALQTYIKSSSSDKAIAEIGSLQRDLGIEKGHHSCLPCPVIVRKFRYQLSISFKAICQ